MFLKVQYRWLLLQASASNYPFQQPGKVERQIPVYPLQQPLGFHGHSLLAVNKLTASFKELLLSRRQPSIALRNSGSGEYSLP